MEVQQDDKLQNSDQHKMSPDAGVGLSNAYLDDNVGHDRTQRHANEILVLLPPV